MSQFVSQSFDGGIKPEFTEALAQTLLYLLPQCWGVGAGSGFCQQAAHRDVGREERVVCVQETGDGDPYRLTIPDREVSAPLCHLTFCMRLHVQCWDGKWGEKKIEVKQKWPLICFQCQGTKSEWMRESKGIDIECEDQVPSLAYFHLK